MEPIQTELVVIGAGPGGYVAAFHAADGGKRVLLVDRDARLGGVCLNSGCIPSKALLHATKVLGEAKEADNWGIHFEPPTVQRERMQVWKESVLEKLAQGISRLARSRGVQVLQGSASFEDSRSLRVDTEQGQQIVRYDTAIIAVGSRPARPQALSLDDARIMTSTEALKLQDIPQRLLVVGGGYIGMELGTVYAALGSHVVLVEAMPSILPGADPDLARPVMRSAQRTFKEVRVAATVRGMTPCEGGIEVVMEVDGQERREQYDRVLVAVGRVANCDALGLERTKVTRDPKGFIQVDAQRRTSDPAISAIGDVVGGALLAHKASEEARIAINAILGRPDASTERVIPAVVYTNPELAWCGLTEVEARERKIPVEVAKFPWGASGRALTLDRPEGLTKLLIEPQSERILGVGIVGTSAGELISEGVLAVQLGATAKDLAETIHPHPTLSETLMEAAETFYGTSPHAVPRQRTVGAS